MLAQATTYSYTGSLSKTKAVIPPRQSAAFFMPACRQSYPSLVGVENSHTTPARGKLYAASFVPRVRPTARIVGGLSQKTKEVIMTTLTIGTSEIRQINGLYSLNDLHKASGGEAKHRPGYFLTNDQTKALIVEIQTAGIPAVKSAEGRNGGSYACKELVIAYAAWISPAFHLKVIRVFLAQVGRTLLASETITKAQQGELATLIAERFPSGKDRPYAWSRFNNHFRLASYKDLPANRFEEACEYIRQMQDDRVALPSTVNLLDKDYFAQVRDIANKFIDDWSRVHKGEDVHPTLTIPDDVLAGIVAQQLSRQNFRLYVDYSGRLMVDAIPNKSPYEGLAKAIEDKGNIGLPDETIHEIGRACVNALAYRAKSRGEALIKARRAAK